MRRTCIAVAGPLLEAAAFTQESPSYQITEPIFNDCGAGTIPTSARYRITLGAVGAHAGRT